MRIANAIESYLSASNIHEPSSKEKRFYVKDKIDKWSSQYSKTGGLLRIIENSSPKDRIEYFLSKNAIGNKKVYWRLITIREEKISQEDIINIINQAKSEALFQI
jgi:hypothetical protein